MKVVVDTNIFVSALLNADGAPREAIRLCLTGQLRPIIGAALFSEYQDVMGRRHIFEKCRLNEIERSDLLNAFFSRCEWISIHFLWRPNLPDEADNHLIELALAGGAETILSTNRRDLMHGQLLFPQLKIRSAGEFLLDWRQTWEQ